MKTTVPLAAIATGLAGLAGLSLSAAAAPASAGEVAWFDPIRNATCTGRVADGGIDCLAGLVEGVLKGKGSIASTSPTRDPKAEPPTNPDSATGSNLELTVLNHRGLHGRRQARQRAATAHEYQNTKRDEPSDSGDGGEDQVQDQDRDQHHDEDAASGGHDQDQEQREDQEQDQTLVGDQEQEQHEQQPLCAPGPRGPIGCFLGCFGQAYCNAKCDAAGECVCGCPDGAAAGAVPCAGTVC